jgi:hypothetical protein
MLLALLESKTNSFLSSQIISLPADAVTEATNHQRPTP